MKASWTRRAELELDEIIAYIAADDPVAALAWGERLIDRADAVASAKYSGRVVPELELEYIREVFVGAYRIVYRVLSNGIRVQSVFEGHRQLPSNFDPDET